MKREDLTGRAPVDSRLRAVYAAALAQPDLLDRASRAYRRWPEAIEVLEGSLDHLWNSILTPEDAAEATAPLAPVQKSWLLVHAGLLRGFNLALITTWRQSGDSLERLEALYPGFVEHGDALHSIATQIGAADRLAPPRTDDRRAVGLITVSARQLLRLGLDRGYGLGFLVDAVLDARAAARESSGLSAASPATGPIGDKWTVAELATLLDAIDSTTRADDPRQIAAISWTRDLDHVSRREALLLLSGADDYQLLGETVARQSLARPLTVPAALARYSPAYVKTMVAYLMRRWLTVGLRLGAREMWGLDDLPSLELLWGRLRIAGWLNEQARAWAGEETPEVIALAADPAALRWRLADLTQAMVAIGWRIGRTVG